MSVHVHVSPKIADHLDRLARDVAYTEGHASVMRAAADVIRQAASPATRETVTEEMVGRAQQSLLSSVGWVRDSYVRDALQAALTEGKAD